ncbi:MAG: coiled-coil domain-containing protein [Candidatus Aminicenantes bacterium]
MSEEKREKKSPREEIKIDYQNIDVADIMAQIKKRIAQKPTKPVEEMKEEWRPVSYFTHSLKFPEEAGRKANMKRLVLKFMRPFSPFIKLIILPVYQEFRETVQILDQTNKRLDSLYQEWGRLNEKIEGVDQRLDQTNKRLDSLYQELGRVDESLNRKMDDFDQRMNIVGNKLGKTMEYTKLLHNLSHNMVVELSKLKIEEENLKLKTRIMEKDFEFLGKREKALERYITR